MPVKFCTSAWSQLERRTPKDHGRIGYDMLKFGKPQGHIVKVFLCFYGRFEMRILRRSAYPPQDSGGEKKLYQIPLHQFHQPPLNAKLLLTLASSIYFWYKDESFNNTYTASLTMSYECGFSDKRSLLLFLQIPQRSRSLHGLGENGGPPLCLLHIWSMLQWSGAGLPCGRLPGLNLAVRSSLHLMVLRLVRQHKPSFSASYRLWEQTLCLTSAEV